jgi:hypothetical protein
VLISFFFFQGASGTSQTSSQTISVSSFPLTYQYNTPPSGRLLGPGGGGGGPGGGGSGGGGGGIEENQKALSAPDSIYLTDPHLLALFDECRYTRPKVWWWW